MISRTFTRNCVFSFFMMSFSTIALAQGAEKTFVCVVDEKEEIVQTCKLGDTLVLPPHLAPSACDYKEEIVVLTNNKMGRYGITAPLSCSYIGYLREMR